MDSSQQEKGVTLVDISKEMRGAYLQYSMSESWVVRFLMCAMD